MTDTDRQKQIDTALYLAVTNGDDAGIDRMLAAGANPNIKADGERSAFSMAVHLMMFDVADKMIGAGANINFQSEPGVSLPPVVAALVRDAATDKTARVGYLLSRGADLSLRFRWGQESACTITMLAKVLPPVLTEQEKKALKKIESLLEMHAAQKQRDLQESVMKNRQKKPGLRL